MDRNLSSVPVSRGWRSRSRLVGGVLTAAASGMFAVDAAAQTLPVLSIDSPSVVEGDSGSANLNFTVTLSAASTSNVTVGYADAGTGTATSGTDYTALTAGTLTIAAGDTSGTITVLVTGDTSHESHETVVVTLSNPTNATVSATAGSGMGTIRDDEGVTLSVNSPTVAEGDSGSTNMNFTVSMSASSTQRVDVIFGITGGTATSGTDYTTGLQNNRIRLRFSPGQTSKTVTVAVQGDTLDEADETVVARLSGVSFRSGARILTGTGTGTITDDDATPTLSIDSPTVTEGDTGSTDMVFTVSLSAASGRQVTVLYTYWTGTATEGTDFKAFSQGTLTFAPGETSKTITVEVLGDTDPEADETVVVNMGGQINANIASDPRGTGTITDDDLALLRTGPASVTEGDSGPTNLNFTVSLAAASGKTVTVDYADPGTGTATSGTDYTALAAGTLTIAPGNTSGTITVEVTGDSVTERHETVLLTLSNPTNARFLTASMASLTGTIRNDDGFPTANAGPDQTVNEGDTVTLSGSGSDPDGDAVTSYRWTQTAGPPVTLTGVTSATASFTAPTGLVADEVLRFSLVVEANDEGASDAADITVNAGATTLNWTAEAGPNQTVEEEDTVTLSGRPLSGGAELTLQGVGRPSYSWRHTGGGASTVSLTGAETATPSFTAPNLLANDDLTFTLTMTIGDNTRTDTVDVTVEADNDGPTANAGPDQRVDEGDTVTLSGSGSDPEGETLSYSWRPGPGDDVEVTLTDPMTRTPSFIAPTVPTDTPLTFYLTVTAGGAGDTDSVVVVVRGGPPIPVGAPEIFEADAGADQIVSEGDEVTLEGSVFGAPDGAALLYAWRQIGSSPTVAIANAGTARATFTAPEVSAATTLAFEFAVTADGDTVRDVVAVVVRNTDAALDQSTVELAAAVHRETDSGHPSAGFVALLQPPSTEPVRAWWETRDGTAKAGKDYYASSGVLTFQPGQTAQTIWVPVIGDLEQEQDETFEVVLRYEGGGTDELLTAICTIIDNDSPTLMLTLSPSAAEEGDEGMLAMAFAAKLSAPSPQPIAVPWTTRDDTARAGEDYEAASGELTFAPGKTEGRIVVNVIGDRDQEMDETFEVVLGDGPRSRWAQTATGTILDDDAVSLAVEHRGRLVEGGGEDGAAMATFVVTLSAPSPRSVYAAYITRDGTARAGQDFERRSGELSFPAGALRREVQVPIIDDDLAEEDETFELEIIEPEGALLASGGAKATATILDDDGDGRTAAAQMRRVLSVADARTPEGAGEAVFAVTLSPPALLPVTVAYATEDGTASAGTDYQATSGELRFAPGETELTVSVPLLGDRTPEADETFMVRLSSPVNAKVGRAAAAGTIVDDDVAEARDRALETSLAGFGRTLTRDAMSAIGGRFEGMPAARGSRLVLGGQHLLSSDEEALPAHQFAGWRQTPGAFEAGWGSTAQAPGFQPPQDLAELGPHGPGRRSQRSLGDFLRQSSFELALGGRGGEGEEAGWNLSLWGLASGGRFSGEPSTGLASRGEAATSYLGMDAKVGERLFAGVALAHSDGEIGYGLSDFSGELDLSLTSVLPYVNFQLSEKLEIWSMMGVGWGEGQFRDAVKSGQMGQTEQDAQGSLDLDLSMVAVGANRALANWRNVDLELKSDAFVLLMKGEAEGGLEAQPELSARSQGVRLALAGRTELMASEQGRLGVNLELGERWDGGDAQTGWGTEVGAGLDYRHAGLGLGVAVQGQYLLVHSAQSLEEKGVSLTLEFAPGVQGKGLSLALRPAWGAYPGGAGELLNNEALLRGTERQAGLGSASERLDLEWGYGLGLRSDAGLLTLRGGLSYQEMGQRAWRFGGLLDMPGSTRGSWELSRLEGLGKPSHGLLIKWEHKW